MMIHRVTIIHQQSQQYQIGVSGYDIHKHGDVSLPHYITLLCDVVGQTMNVATISSSYMAGICLVLALRLINDLLVVDIGTN